MKKELIKNFLQQEITAKQTLLTNSISEDDKAFIQTRIEELTAMVEKVDALEDEAITIEAVDGLKQALDGLKDQLEAVNEKLNQKQEETNNETMTIEENTYLKSTNAVKDFLSAVKKSGSNEEFTRNWNEMLTTNGITVEMGSEEAYLPEAVRGAINDVWERNNSWLKDLKHTGAKRFYVRHNSSDQNDEYSRARGWNKGDYKQSQELTVNAKLIEAMFIYKLISIDVKTLFDTDDELLNYVINELGDQIMREIARCVLVGDGRDGVMTPGHITSFEAMVGVEDAYRTVTNVTEDGFLVDDMVAAVNTLHNPYNKPTIAFMSASTLTTLRRVQASASSTPVYISVEQVAEMIGVSRIEKTDLLGDAATCVICIPSEYYLVGDILSPSFMKDHQIYTNEDVYREELCIGGGINGLKSVAILKEDE